MCGDLRPTNPDFRKCPIAWLLMFCWSHTTRSHLYLIPLMTQFTSSQPTFLLIITDTINSDLTLCQLAQMYCPLSGPKLLCQTMWDSCRPAILITQMAGGWKEMNTREQPLSKEKQEAVDKFPPHLSLRQIIMRYILHSSSKGCWKDWGPVSLEITTHSWVGFVPFPLSCFPIKISWMQDLVSSTAFKKNLHQDSSKGCPTMQTLKMGFYLWISCSQTEIKSTQVLVSQELMTPSM